MIGKIIIHTYIQTHTLIHTHTLIYIYIYMRQCMYVLLFAIKKQLTELDKKLYILIIDKSLNVAIFRTKCIKTFKEYSCALL